ncbi:hypothetical protein ABKS89_11495 [Pseudomonas sp. LABIM340]|uniref:hypothetical protein n=1 Tax=Pseudomonas sp. LABIM340 TaxID=3156585 RepID=UPI0032AFF737
MKMILWGLPLSVVPFALCSVSEAAEQPQAVIEEATTLSTVVVKGKLEKDKQDIDKKQLEDSNLHIASDGFDDHGYAKLGGGNFHSRLYELGQNINLIDDKLAARVSLHSESRDSYYENLDGPSLNPIHDDAARVQFLVKPDDVSDLLIGLNYRDYRDDGNIRFPRGTSATGTTNFGYQTADSWHRLSLNTPTWSDLRQFGASKRGPSFGGRQGAWLQSVVFLSRKRSWAAARRSTICVVWLRGVLPWSRCTSVGFRALVVT